MKRVFISFTIFILAISLFAGCGKMSGTYYSNMEDEKDVAVEFKPDGTFDSLYAGKKIKSGKYEKKGDSVTLITDDGGVMKGTLDGDTLTIEHEYSGTKTYTKR